MRKTFDIQGEALIAKALVFATAAHAAVAQKRKYTGEDYIVHPIALAERARSLPNATPEMIAGLLLHDTVEDTRIWLDDRGNRIDKPAIHHKNGGTLVLVEGITIKLIKAEFGIRVAEFVDGMTEASMPWDGNRDQRKAIDRMHLAKLDGEIQTAKLVDIWHNTHNIAEFDPGFAQKYLAEKWADLGVMTKADAEFLDEVRTFIQGFLNRNRAA